MDTPPKHVSRRGGAGNCLLFPRDRGEKERGGMLDKMVKQVVLYCVLLRCPSAGCVEQTGQGALLWILSVAVTSLPP